MGRILVPPDKLMQVADQFLQGKQQMGHMCDQLNRQMMFVQGGWDGLTSQRFFQDFQRAQQSMSVTLERLSTVAQELIFISKSFTQIDGEKVVLDVPGNGVPIKTASSGEGWLHKIFEQIGQAEITKAEAQMEASKLQGEILWDTAQGAKGAIQEDLTLGMLPDKERDYDHPMAAKVGEILGHVATTLQGAGEVIVGTGGEGLSVAVSSTGVGSIIGIPGLIGSAALAAHGGTTAVKGASGIGKSSAELWQMAKGEGGGSSKPSLSSEVKAESVPHTESKGRNQEELKQRLSHERELKADKKPENHMETLAQAEKKIAEHKMQMEKLIDSDGNFNPSNGVIENGKISEHQLQSWVPSGASNNFRPDPGIIESGYKYNFNYNGTKVEIKWHSPQLNLSSKLSPSELATSNSYNGWSAQIKIGRKYLGTDGNMYRNNQQNITHIPVDLGR
ncbi:WXG100 family type VII secretion target [Paenibacillus maysiensis]|uniref:WXG100 family type VII secretion target n=1 Tax=Paenibacillus maysiensis TaxID=1155954 RepID=UPI0004B4C090|nr:WXG100 family type VII secretion target [Paenibacillus maysiensis]